MTFRQKIFLDKFATFNGWRLTTRALFIWNTLLNSPVYILQTLVNQAQSTWTLLNEDWRAPNRFYHVSKQSLFGMELSYLWERIRAHPGVMFMFICMLTETRSPKHYVLLELIQAWVRWIDTHMKSIQISKIEKYDVTSYVDVSIWLASKRNQLIWSFLPPIPMGMTGFVGCQPSQAFKSSPRCTPCLPVDLPVSLGKHLQMDQIRHIS